MWCYYKGVGIVIEKRGSTTPCRKILNVETPWASLNESYERYIRSHYNYKKLVTVARMIRMWFHQTMALKSPLNYT